MKLTKNFYENKAWEKNKLVCGIDEVGRGCLAGPVVAAACILPVNTKSKVLKDSKVMTSIQREDAFSWIEKNCVYSVAIFDHKKIDKFNIYQTTKFVMNKALLQVALQQKINLLDLEYILVDAMPLILNDVFVNSKFFHFPKGETYSTSIAAASIVAKVFRDNLMNRIDKIFPDFDFKINKGYGTGNHLDVIKKVGISIIHRKSFLSKIIKKNISKSNEIQASLF